MTRNSHITFINKIKPLTEMLKMLNKILGSLKSLKSLFKKISEFMSGVINFILLFFVYFIGIGIVSIVMKLFGKHFLEMRRQNKIANNKILSNNKLSNWQGHKLTKQPLEDYYRTF